LNNNHKHIEPNAATYAKVNPDFFVFVCDFIPLCLRGQGCRVRDHIVNTAQVNLGGETDTTGLNNKVYEDLLAHRDAICVPYQRLTDARYCGSPHSTLPASTYGSFWFFFGLKSVSFGFSLDWMVWMWYLVLNLLF